MKTKNDLFIEDSEASPKLLVAVLLTYMIAGFITTCICGLAYLVFSVK